jgi:hypothetical protein
VPVQVGITMPVVSRLRVLWARLRALPPVRQDALLYAGAALFALTLMLADTGDYHDWASISLAPYAVAALACEICARLRPSPAAVRRVRTTVVLAVTAAVVAVPIGALSVWRAQALPGPHAQPEVRVIEAAGDRLAAGHDPYLHEPRTVGVDPTNDDKAVDADSYFPYLPGMAPFGLPNAWSGWKELGDARVPLAGFTIVVVAVALLASDAPRGRRGRVLQILLVLPTGALPLSTGGDDLPVLALMLLSLVLAEGRRPVLSGLAAGAAGTLKLTAWPLALVLGAAQRDRSGRRVVTPYVLALAAFAVPVIVAGFVPDPSGFVANVVKFPLGLASVKSPAASPLLGQVLTTVFPASGHAVTAALLAVGAVAVLVIAWRMPPTSPFAAARLTGLALLLATVLAPATRFGYLIYPINLLAWAYLLVGPGKGAAPEGEGQSASCTCTRSSSSRLVGAV